MAKKAENLNLIESPQVSQLLKQVAGGPVQRLLSGTMGRIVGDALEDLVEKQVQNLPPQAAQQGAGGPLALLNQAPQRKY